MPWSYAWRTSLVNPSCPSARCVAPLTDPVPNASRVTLTPDFPSVTQSVAVPRAARKGSPPVPARTPAASPVFKKLRLEQSDMCALRMAIYYHEFGPHAEGFGDVSYECAGYRRPLADALGSDRSPDREEGRKMVD